MAFLGGFKKNRFWYFILLGVGTNILIINNLFQFLDLIQRENTLLLYSALSLIIILVYIGLNKEEVLK